MKIGVPGAFDMDDEAMNNLELTIINRGNEISVLSGDAIRPILMGRNERRVFAYPDGRGIGCQIGRMEKNIDFNMDLLVSGLDASVSPILFEAYADGP